MADITVTISEELSLDNNLHNNTVKKTFSGVNNIDHRTLTAVSGSVTTIFEFANDLDSGTFTTSSLVYGRITNLSTDKDINLHISSSELNFNQKVSAGGSHLLSTSEVTGSFTGSLSAPITFNQVNAIKVEPISGSARVEYYITTS